MSEVLYHGKKYYEADRRAQVALASAGIYSFRYYPKDRLVIMTDLTVENFGCEKYYDPVPGRIVEQLVVPEDRKLCEDLFDKIDQAENRIMPIAQINELIRDLSYLPYRVVTQLMGVINNKENFLKYFVPIDQQKK